MRRRDDESKLATVQLVADSTCVALPMRMRDDIDDDGRNTRVEATV
jgi:hypothetical protein